MTKGPVFAAPPESSPRLSSCTRWDSPGWRQLRVIVAGMGKSGVSAAKVLTDRGCQVIVIDESDALHQRKTVQELENMGARDVIVEDRRLKSLPDFDGSAADLMVASPALPPYHRFFHLAAGFGIPVWSDIELAWQLRLRPDSKAARWICITGTNGKTTTTSLTETILSQATDRGRTLRAVAVGNIGTPVLDVLYDAAEYDYFVVELSSFQLHWTYSISPYTSVCLNVAEDHLEWHGSYGQYLEDKAKIYRNTQVACIYNEDDAESKAMVKTARVRKGCRFAGFTVRVPDPGMLGVVEGAVIDRAFSPKEGADQEIVKLSALQERSGRAVPMHMVANVLAATALARAVGVSEEAVSAGVLSYRPGAHRIEYIKTYAGVDYVDDSKATNPHAALASLRCFDSVVWIVGGLSKGVDYTELIKEAAPLLRAVIVIGEDQERVLSALRAEADDIPCEIIAPYENGVAEDDSGDVDIGGRKASKTAIKKPGAEVMRQAVRIAGKLARCGDVVLLAPAAASMDQFVSYEDRGKKFGEAVLSELREEEESQA